MKKYTHLFFDLDNTLWDFKTNSRCAMEITYQAFALEKQKVIFSQFYEVYSDVNKKLWEAYRKKEIRKKELTNKRFSLTFETLGIQGIDPDKMNEYYLTEMPKQKHLLANTINVLQELKTKGYALNIITNGFKEVQRKKLVSSGLDSFFNKLFISEEVKTPKPGREIFEHALKSSNAKKSKSVMIGDDWEVDILGAAKFGIDAIYLRGNEKCISKLERGSDKVNEHIRQINDLSDLLLIM